VAKRRARTDWQLDLKPVALTPPPERSTSNGRTPGGHLDQPAAVPRLAEVSHPSLSSPGLAKALDDLRAADSAVLRGLREIHSSVSALRLAVDEVSVRLANIEARVNAQPAASKPRSRPTRETSRALRESTTDALEGRGDATGQPSVAEGTLQ
jgi:hypothetical protein